MARTRRWQRTLAGIPVRTHTCADKHTHTHAHVHTPSTNNAFHGRVQLNDDLHLADLLYCTVLTQMGRYCTHPLQEIHAAWTCCISTIHRVALRYIVGLLTQLCSTDLPYTASRGTMTPTVALLTWYMVKKAAVDLGSCRQGNDNKGP